MVALSRDPNGPGVLKSSVAGMTSTSSQVTELSDGSCIKKSTLESGYSDIFGLKSKNDINCTNGNETKSSEIETVLQLKKRITALESELRSCQQDNNIHG